MPSIAVAMMGIGAWIMYASYKHQQPLTTALKTVSNNTPPPITTAPSSKAA